MPAYGLVVRPVLGRTVVPVNGLGVIRPDADPDATPAPTAVEVP